MGAIFWLVTCLSILQACSGVDYSSDSSVQLFQEYLRINTTTGNDLTAATDFWKTQAAQEDLPIYIYEYTEGYPLIVIKWAGTNSSLPSVMLNSHMDVVPADEEDGWTYPPFEAQIDDNGDIYARGAQDMKSVTIQYFEAIRRLKAKNVTLARDVYITIMPDEEVGGENGMIPFLESTEFESMNIGVEMDEGTSFPLPLIAMFYQDKVVWQIQVDCYGVAGHGSSFPDTNSTAVGKCMNVVNRLQKFRDDQYAVYEEATIMNAGLYTSVNLNIIEAGTANNVMPQLVSLIYDIRLAISVNEEEFQAQLSEWIEEAGDNITLTYILQNQQSPATIISDTNPYWVALSSAAQNLNITLATIVPPGSTDARYVRNIGIPAFGFSPMPNTPLLLHSVDERLNAATFLQGIDIYEEFITSLANIPGDQTLTEYFSYVAKTT